MMLNVHIENVGKMAVIECEGTIARSEAASTLREAVTSQCDSQIIVVEFSAVPSIEANGLSMLIFLQRWAHDHQIRLKLFNLKSLVRAQIKRVNSMREFDIASLDEMMALISQENRHERKAQ